MADRADVVGIALQGDGSASATSLEIHRNSTVRRLGILRSHNPEAVLNILRLRSYAIVHRLLHSHSEDTGALVILRTNLTSLKSPVTAIHAEQVSATPRRIAMQIALRVSARLRVHAAVS